MNNFEIIESSENQNARWITYTPNNSNSFYGALEDFDENRIKRTLNHDTSLLANMSVSHLVWGQSYVQKYKTDIPRKLTLEEYLTLKQIIEKSNYKYNKKKKCLIEN